MSTHWKSYPTLAAAADACARDTAAVLNAALAERGRAAFAVSGGGPPKLLFGHLAQANLDWNRIHVFFVDERCVPPDHEASNFLLCRQHLLEPARVPFASVHRMKGEVHAPVAAAEYERDLRAFFGGDGVPRFDLILRGMGPDAHTASLFPGEPLIHDRRGLVGYVEVENLYRHRITLLPAVLLNARETFVLAGGAEKAEKIEQVFNGPRDVLAYPSQLDTPWASWVTWYLDDAAAAPLTKE